MNFKKSYNRIFNDCSSGNSILLVMIGKLQLNSRERTNVKRLQVLPVREVRPECAESPHGPF